MRPVPTIARLTLPLIRKATFLGKRPHARTLNFFYRGWAGAFLSMVAATSVTYRNHTNLIVLGISAVSRWLIHSDTQPLLVICDW
jgi:hypothetical protein